MAMSVHVLPISGPIHNQRAWSKGPICYCHDLNGFLSWESLVTVRVEIPHNIVAPSIGTIALQHDAQLVTIVKVGTSFCYVETTRVKEVLPIDAAGTTLVHDVHTALCGRSMICDPPAFITQNGIVISRRTLGKGCVLESVVSGTYRLCYVIKPDDPMSKFSSSDLERGAQAAFVTVNVTTESEDEGKAETKLDFSDRFVILSMKNAPSDKYGYNTFVDHCQDIDWPVHVPVPATRPKAPGTSVPAGPGGGHRWSDLGDAFREELRSLGSYPQGGWPIRRPVFNQGENGMHSQQGEREP